MSNTTLDAKTVYGHQFKAGCFDYVSGAEFDIYQAKEAGYVDGWAYGRDVFEW